MADPTNTYDEDTIIYGNSLNIPAYDAASTDYRNAQRQAYLADADLLAVNELTLIQSRSRHVARNNAIAHAAENKFVTKLGSIKVLWKKPDGTAHELMQSLWDEFYADPSLDGKGNGDVLQATWNHDRFQSGEALARLLIVTKDNPNRVKLKVQNIESEYLDISYMGEADENSGNLKTRYGITFENSKPKYYNFFADNYYGLTDVADTSYTRRKVAAQDVLHIFERLRSNQWRGVPIIAPMLSNLYELTDLREATVSKQKSAAAIAWIIEQTDGLALNPAGSVRTAGKTNANDPKKKIVFANNGGSVQYTNPGDKFNLVQSSDIGNNLLGLIKQELQAIATAYGIPYYMLSGDTESLSFAAIRGILIEFRDRLEYIHHFINIPDGMDKLTARFKALASLSYSVSDAKASYQFPRNYGVDELKDTQSDILEIQAGLATSESKRAERHVTFEEVLKGQEQDKELGKKGLLDISSGSSGQNLTNGNSTATSKSSSI